MANRKVLLIVDVQQGFIKKGMEKILTNIEQHLAKEHYDLVIQSKWENHMGSNYEQELGYTQVGNSTQSNLLITDYTENLIVRCQYTCITDKFHKLVDKDDTIYVVGVDLDACVLSTLYSLWDQGYKFHVYEDSVGTPVKALHKPTLQLITRNFGKGCLI